MFGLGYLGGELGATALRKVALWQVFSTKREQLVAVRVDRPNPLRVESRPKIKNNPIKTQSVRIELYLAES